MRPCDEPDSGEPGVSVASDSLSCVFIVRSLDVHAGNEVLISEESPCAADFSAGGRIVQETTILAVEGGGHSSAGRHVELTLGGKEVSLGSYAAVFLLGAVLAACVVSPDEGAVVHSHPTDEETLGGKDARPEIGDSILHQDPCPDRPQRDHPPIADDFPVAERGLKLPEQPAIVRPQAVGIAIVRAYQDTVLRDGGGEANGSPGEGGPANFARRCIEGVNLVVRR